MPQFNLTAKVLDSLRISTPCFLFKPVTLESFKDPNREPRLVAESHSPFFRRPSIPSDVISKTTTPHMLRPFYRNADAFRFDTRPLTVAGLIAVYLAEVKKLSIQL